MKCKTCGQEVQENVIQEIPKKTLEWGRTCEQELNWQDAKDWCKKQGKSWRLPTRVELLQAYDEKVFGFGAGSYWSETEVSATGARDVYFPDGSQDTSGKTATYYVRCVKG
jgi:hypothetical protein